ncbi:MAG: 50S ribosomal protein L39e [Candidatus Woesearchaeota archaeon]
MTRNIQHPKKMRLMARGRQTRWAPYWVIPKVFGLGRRLHPSRITANKRHWKRQRIKI